MNAALSRPGARLTRRPSDPGRDAGFVVLDVLLGILVLAILVLSVIMSVGPYRVRAYVASTTSDARQLGEKIQAQLADNKTLGDAGLPTTDAVLDEAQVSALGVNLTRGVVVSRYAPLSSTNFQVCLVHASSGVVDAYALFDSTRGRVTTSGRGTGPAACTPAGTLPTPSLPSGSTPTGTPTTGPTPPAPTQPPDTGNDSGLGTPTNVVARATPGASLATVTWDAVDGASSYAVYLDGASTPAWTGSGTTTDLTGLSVGPHSVTVTARANGKESANSPTSTFRIYGDNDFIVNAHPVTANQPGQPWRTVDYDGATASQEPSEPSGSGAASSYQSRWWKLTADATRTYTFTVAQAADGSTLYTYPQITVWESSATQVTGLPAAPVASTGNTITNTVRVAVEAGKTYLVRVSAMSDGANYKGKFRLEAAPGPVNDSLDGALAITGLQPGIAWLSTDANNTYAEAQAGEPAAGNGGMWWTMTAPRTATYTMRVVADSTGAGPYTYPKLFAWQSSSTDVTTLGTPVASENNIANVIRIQAIAGQTYKIRISTANSTSTNYRSPFRLEVTPGPSNDSLVDAMQVNIAGAGATWTSPEVDNTYAGPQAGEPANADGGMWWTMTAPTTGTYTFEVISPESGAAFPKYAGLRAWTTTSDDVTTIGAFTAGNTSGGGLTARFSMPVTAGQTYKIRVHCANSYSTDYRRPFRFQVRS